MQEMASRFSKFCGGGGGGGGGRPRTPLANSLTSLGRAPRIITLQSIFETWQACKHTKSNQSLVEIHMSGIRGEGTQKVE